MLVIYKRELKSYFTSVIGYLFLAITLIFTGICCSIYNLYFKSPFFEEIVYLMSIIFIVAIPILTMRSLAEERRHKTDQLLSSLPLSSTQIVLGKYFALVTILAISVVAMVAYPIVLSFYGDVSLLTSLSSLCGLFLLGCCLIAIGLFVSSLTDNQIIAAIISFAIAAASYLLPMAAQKLPNTVTVSYYLLFAIFILFGLLTWFLTKNLIVGVGVTLIFEVILTIIYFYKDTLLSPAVNAILDSTYLFDHLYNFIMGVFDLNTVVYYLSIAVLFLFFTVQSLERRRWS